MESSGNTRTGKEHIVLGEFSNLVFVVCPHCKGKAQVSTQFGQYMIPYPFETKSSFTCNNCYKPINEKLWFGPIVVRAANKKCGFCGAKLTYNEKVDKFSEEITVKCESCQQKKTYKISCSKTYANNNQATDPNFGLPLWLQYPVDGNIFWAYNYEHLDYLKKYVSAKLREEGTVSKYAMTQNLPNFIKLAKNREGILKIISRLEKINFKPA